jgi:hypothetical protein
MGRVLVAGLAGECHRPAQRRGRGVLVACLAGLEPVLDSLGKLGLAGVVGDMAVDPSGQRLLIGPDRPDQPLTEGLRSRCRVEDQADPGGKLLLADRSRLDFHAQVVVAALGPPKRR